jgi:AcrR family transcriptional regulator
VQVKRTIFEMPRTADQHLQERILKAAQRLWRTKGEKGLTLRAVAHQAGTTTTTVYKRFRNKEALRYALAERVYKLIIARTTSATSIEEAIRRYLHFAENHPREYRLLFGTLWAEIIGVGPSRPVQTWLLGRLAARFGGRPGDYEQVYFALFLATHGAASLLTAAPKSRASINMRENCIAVCDTLLKNISIFHSSLTRKKKK